MAGKEASVARELRVKIRILQALSIQATYSEIPESILYIYNYIIYVECVYIITYIYIYIYT